MKGAHGDDGMSDEQAQQSPLYRALSGTRTLDVFARVLEDESNNLNDAAWPFAQKALKDYMGRSLIWEDEELERLGGLLARYGARLLSLDVMVFFFEKCAPRERRFSPLIFDLIAHGRLLMREKKGVDASFGVLTPFGQIIREENSRKDPFCASLLPFLSCLIPLAAPYDFGRGEKSLGQSEKAYAEFRADKDRVLLSLVHWRTEFKAATDPRAKVPQETFELLRWLACIQLDGVCCGNPVAALRCLSSFARVTQSFPPALTMLFREALLGCVDSGSGLLDGLFPIAMKEGGFEANSVVDDPVRDLVLLSENAGRDEVLFRGVIDQVTSLGIAQRQEVFSHSSGSSFHPRSRRFIFGQESMVPWHRVMVRDLFFRLLGKANKAATILECFQAGLTVPLSTLFSNGNETIWCVFVVWWVEHMAFVEKDKRLAKGEPSPVEKIFPQMVMNSFKQFASSVETRSITVNAIPRDNSSLLHTALGAMGLHNSAALCAELSREVERKYTVAQNFKKICERFLPDDPCGDLLKEVLDGWSNWRVTGLSYAFREAQEATEGSPSRPFPATLVDSLPWVLFLMKSEFFEFIWLEVEGFSNLSKLEAARRAWEDLFVSIDEKSISFPRLEEIVKFLNANELEIFYRSTRSKPFQKEEALSWGVRPRDGNALERLSGVLKKWVHLQGVCENLQVIGDCFPLMAQWIASGSKDKSLVAARNHVNSLCTALEENPWDMQRLADYDKFAVHCEAIHPCLLQLHPAFFEKIAESTELLDWLRTLPDDQDFTRGIEMAMGRSEMECPPELWLEEKGQPGRVNEQILSMLQSVRSYLHKFIFRESQKFASAEDFVNDFLAHLLKFEKTILVQMGQCNRFREPLVALLSGGTENSAPGRLMRMLHPSSNSQWVCDSKGLLRTLEDSSSGIGSCLRLEYTAHDKMTRALAVSEIEDFQSSVVLSRTDQKEKETQDAIINFVQSFGWMKAYATHLVTLNSLGHFGYGSFSYVAPLQASFETIREKALSAESELREWENSVGSVRMKYPSLNHFGMKLVWKFVEFLRERVQRGFSPSESGSLVQKLVHLVNPVLAEKDHVIADLENDLVAIWKKIACHSSEAENDEDDEPMSLHAAFDGVDKEGVFEEKEMSLSELLDCCGQTIQSVFGSLPFHSPKADLPDDVIPLSLKRGDLRLIVAKTYESVFQEVFSCFAQCHTFPERRTLLLCRENTTWEEVFLLLLRWRFSGQSDKLFSIANADLLSNEIQIRCVAFIQEFRTNQAPLLVICGPNRLAYVATQFANRRMPSFPLPRPLLQGLVEKKFDRKFESFVSDHAGAGKSFQIRKKCAEAEGGNYVVVAASSLKQFLLLTKQALETDRGINTESPSFFDEDAKTCSLFLHIEVYDTVGVELNSYLFELLFFGGYCDFMSEEIFFYPPSSTVIAIEIPTGPLAKHLSVPQLCPVHKVSSCAEQFAPSKKEMIRGMGLPLFYGNRYDGTALRKREHNVRHANAFDRLQYVCYALNMLEENGGSFPYILETGVEEPEGLLDSLRLSASPGISDSIEDGSIAGSKCFELLVEASHLQGQVSLWCLWNFVNMVYWQLRDMHFPNSPLNVICMPTEKKENGEKVLQKESNEAKMQMKGEILAFILETAREFATRQTNETDPNEVIGVEITGLSRAAFRGKWARMGFANSGRPVFRTKERNSTYYFYYRQKSNRWVIDDSIASAGPSYSYTEGIVWGMGVWRSTNQWKMDRDIKVTKVKDANGYNGEALEVKGFANGDCNGMYFRQPPYSDINGQAHYIKLEGERRHIFKGFMWFLCPVCTVDEGTLGTSTDLRRWNIKPPDTVEREVEIKELRQGDWDFEGGSSQAAPVPSDDPADDDEELMAEKSEDFLEFLKLENLFRKTKRWVDSNHECLLFSNTNHIVSFLSMSPNKMRDGMHPNLLEFLKNNKVDVGESLDQLSTRHHEVLGALTEVYREGDDAKKVGGGSYCLTGDNLLKMLAIFIRLRVGIPVILMGECGCGKTSLLNYLCEWLGVTLTILDVHGGTTPLDILQVFEKAKRERELTKKPQYVFLDEVNACNHMGLICEAITRRTLYGVDIHNDIHILAALNPYRRRPPRANTFGLVYKQKKGAVSPVVKDDMASLVYRVTPIPVALRDFVFDFGALGPDQEALYVQSMIQSQLQLPSLENLEHSEAEQKKAKRERDLKVISGLVVQSQNYIRKEEGDPSSVSLRDVRRFLFFGNFFLGLKTHTDEWFVSSIIVSLALVYYFRLSSEKSRLSYWENVCCPETGLNRSNDSSFKIPQDKGFKDHIEYFRSLLTEAQFFFCSQVELGEGIALNAALTENLFVTIVCILNKVPVFLVGKPGTSKTLTLQIIASNLQGKQSPNPFWRKYPSVYVFPYQCSPMSDSGSIQQQFNMAVRYQEHANNTITVLLLDEVGLAEHSPDMPLKCLHGMLVEPPISIVGLSNWVLDPAKMNRAVLVQRPEPSHRDISQTGSSIMDLSHGSSETMLLLEKISRAYFRVYTNQKGRDFIGMRDYYSLVKSLRAELRAAKAGSGISKEQAIFAICRNFSGREDILKDVLFVMCEELYGNPKKHKMGDMEIGKVAKYFKFERPSLGELIRLNLTSSYDSRHLMLLTHNCSALSLVFSCDLVSRKDTKVIIGSEFVEDDTELFLIQQMNEVKLAMATGKTIILMNADNMYEALYDVLNQRYLIKHDQATGKSVRLLRLAIGSRSSLCHVEPGFRIIVIAEKDYAYRELDLPLLNRFEKQILTPSEVLDRKGKRATDELEEWIDGVLRETDLPSLQSIFCGYHPGTIPSLVFRLRQTKSKELVAEAKRCLKRIANPAAIALSPSLLAVDGVRMHETLLSFVDELFDGKMKKPAAAIAMTYSPVTHLHEGSLLGSLNAQVEVCRLDQVKSEKTFFDRVVSHLKGGEGDSSGANRLLIVQFDPIMCSSLQINHAKHLATTALSSVGRKSDKVAILFLVHLPPGLRTRTRHFVLDFEVRWSCAFLDDIRGFALASDKRLDIPSLLRMPLSELFQQGVVSFKEIVNFQLPEAVYRLRILTPPTPKPLPFLSSFEAFHSDFHDRTDVSKRIHSLKRMFEFQPFQDFFCDCVMSILKHHGSLKDEKTGILLHVSLAIGESCGTLMESLCRVVSEMTLQAIINLLYVFEKNFTLGTMKSDPKLWMSFVSNKNVFDLEAVSFTFKVGKRATRELQDKCAVNTGKTQAFISKFPFSYAIFDLLSGASTRQAIEATLQGATGFQRFKVEIQSMETAFVGFFGEEVAQYIRDKSDCLGYFHDFVAMIAPQVDKLCFEEIEFVHLVVLQSFHPDALCSPAAIHASFRQNERKIRIICSILSVLPERNRQAVMMAMQDASNIPTHSHRTAAVLEAVFSELSKSIWIRASNLEFVNGKLGVPCSGSSHLPILISSASENVNDLLFDYEEERARIGDAPSDGPSPWNQWRSIMLLKVFLETYEKERVQWGMGDKGKMIIELLRNIDPTSLDSFSQIFVALADFFSIIRPCIECTFISHVYDRSHVERDLCLRCTSAHEIAKRKRVVERKVGGKTSLGHDFWDHFLLTPTQREATLRDTREVGSLKSVEPQEGEKALEKSLVDEEPDAVMEVNREKEIVVQQATKRQAERVARRFLEAILVRFFGEVIFAPALPSDKISSIERKLVSHVNSYLNAISGIIPDPASAPEDLRQFLQFTPSPSTRLSLMHIFLRAERKANVAEGFFEPISATGKSVYLSHCVSAQEELANSIDLDSFESLGRIASISSPQDDGAVLEWLNDNPEGWGSKRENLEALAKVQVALRWYGKLVGSDEFPPDELAGTAEFAKFSDYFNKLLSNQPTLETYVMKSIKEASSLEAVLFFLFSCRKKGCNWVRFDESQLHVVIEESPVGPWLPSNRFKELHEFRGLIVKSLPYPKNSEEFNRVVAHPNLHDLLFPAIFNEISHQAVLNQGSEKFLADILGFVDRVSSHLQGKGEASMVVAELLPLATQVALLLKCGRSRSKLLNRSLVPVATEEGEELSSKAQALAYTLLRLLSGAMAQPESWLADLIVAPQKWAERYLPGSKFESPLDGVTWYECPNGHSYSVGQCGRPMERGKCPTCGAEIGGQNHTNVKGVRQTNKPSEDFVNHLGYQVVVNERVNRLDTACAAFFRLIVDSCLFLACFTKRGGKLKAARLIRLREADKCDTHLASRLRAHFLEICQSHRLDNMLGGVLVKAVFCLCYTSGSLLWSSGAKFNHKNAVFSVENMVKTLIRNAAGDIQADIKYRIDSSNQSQQREEVVEKALGREGWDALLEAKTEDLTEAESMFSFVPPPTLNHFLLETDSLENFADQHPLLSAFLEEENRLQNVRYIIPVLEWHKLLFSVFQNGELDREEALKIPNAEAVARLPADEQARGRKIMEEYCVAFNASFPLVGERLFECEANPFLKDGEVNLPGKMGPDTPVSFSLPSISDGQKQIDPNTLVTVRLLAVLHRIHEDCLGLGAARGEEEAGEANRAGDDQFDVGLPEISCDSPLETVRQKLILYDRGTHLLPLLNTYSFVESGVLRYDLAQVEDGLRFGVLGGKQSTRLHTKFYVFRGDVRSSGQLASLKTRIPQKTINDQTMQLVLGEVDTQSKVIRLLSSLEVVINFITRIGGRKGKELGIGKMFVRDYAVSTLNMDVERWEAASTPTIDEHVRLWHLSFLFMRLQVEMEGNPFDDLKPEYRLTLEESQLEELRKRMETEGEKYSVLLRDKLHDFILNQILKADWSAPELDLKEYLQYAFNDAESADWFEDHFPDLMFTFQHAHALYLFLLANS